MKKEVIKFGLVGFTSTVVDFVMLNLLTHFGLTIFWAIFFGYLFGAANGYIINNNWTYRHLSKPTTFWGFTQYATISFIGLGLTEAIVYVLYNVFHTGLNVDKLVAVVLVFAWNFLGNQLFTFKVAKPAADIS